MALIELQRDPSPRDLRLFPLVVLLFCGVAGGLVHWRLDAPSIALAIWTTGVVLVLTFALPPCRRPIYLAWMLAFFPLGWLLSHLMLALVYYFVLVPIGLLMRLARRDPMQRDWDRAASTYWQERPPSRRPRTYFRQF